jgi:sucrose-6-phosphate hydrolase SacC (GH32 family)
MLAGYWAWSEQSPQRARHGREGMTDTDGQDESLMRELTIEKPYLHLPVKNGAPQRLMRFVVEDREVREFVIELADAEPDFWVFADVSAFRGRELQIHVDELPAGSQGVASIQQADDVPGADCLYQEKHRPQFHFSSRRGWNNDPNGLVYYQGTYHLFYQHNPYGWNWGNMHWGHAVSTDLVHWTELPDALYPDDSGTMFSGSAVVDWHNTAGFQQGSEKAVVVFYTAAGGESPASEGRPFTQAIAYSTDGGQTFAKYAGNPVIPHLEGANRDPKVIWHGPTGRWVMALYLGERDEAHYHALFASSDLRSWTKLREVALADGGGECPDLFELPVDGDPEKRKWVFSQASGHYLIGSFDGETFAPEVGPLRWQGDGSAAYAAQTFSDIPAQDGRRIQIAWLTQKLPGMPFNQMMTFPVELTLRTTGEGPRLFVSPVKEIELLHDKRCAWENETLAEGSANLLAGLRGDLFHLRAEFEIGDAQEVGFIIHGVPVFYHAAKQEVTCGKASGALRSVEGRVRLEMLVDRASIELFGNDGETYLVAGMIPPDDKTSLELVSRGGTATVESLEVYELRSAWR